jgi:hypothetical protein
LFGTRVSISGTSGARLARIGIVIVETSGGGGGAVASGTGVAATDVDEEHAVARRNSDAIMVVSLVEGFN